MTTPAADLDLRGYIDDHKTTFHIVNELIDSLLSELSARYNISIDELKQVCSSVMAQKRQRTNASNGVNEPFRCQALTRNSTQCTNQASCTVQDKHLCKTHHRAHVNMLAKQEELRNKPRCVHYEAQVRSSPCCSPLCCSSNSHSSGC